MFGWHCLPSFPSFSLIPFLSLLLLVLVLFFPPPPSPWITTKGGLRILGSPPPPFFPFFFSPLFSGLSAWFFLPPFFLSHCLLMKSTEIALFLFFLFPPLFLPAPFTYLFFPFPYFVVGPMAGEKFMSALGASLVPFPSFFFSPFLFPSFHFCFGKPLFPPLCSNREIRTHLSFPPFPPLPSKSKSPTPHYLFLFGTTVRYT